MINERYLADGSIIVPAVEKEALNQLNAFHGKPLRFLLVMPQFPPSFWGFHYVGRYFGKTCMMPPLALATIAGMCPSDWEIRIVDQNVGPLTDGDLGWADLVGVTAMIVQYSGAVQIARRARSLGKPVMIGGPHATGEPHVYENEFDILVLNEGEITFRQFLSDYQAGKIASRYATTEKASLEDTPVARYDLLRYPKRYINFTLQFSRGCPYECEFCDVTALLGRQHRTRPVSAFLKDLDAIRTTGYHGPIFIADDNIAINKRKAIELCNAIAEWNERNNHPFTYYSEMSVNVAGDEELLAHLEKARFNSIYLGLETPSAESLKSMGKSHNLKVNIKDLIRRIQSHGIRVDSGFIVGFDCDTPDIFRRQADYIKDLGITTAMAGILTAFSSTALFKRLKAEGRILSDETPLAAEKRDEGYNVGGHLNIIPKNFSVETLLEGYAYILSEIYGPKNFFDRLLKQISTLKPDHRSISTVLKWSFFFFPMVSLLILLFFPFRFQYLRAALIALLRYPGKLMEFSFLSMCGIHYIEFSRREVLPWIQKEKQRLASDRNESLSTKETAPKTSLYA